MFKKLGLLFLALTTFTAVGQTTAVTATITDADTTVWINPAWQVRFVPAPNFPNLSSYTINGVALTSSTYISYLSLSGTGNSSGVISTTLLDNNQIFPAGSKWEFIVQSQTSSPAISYPPTVITGASQSLSSFLSTNSTAPRFPAVGSAFGYSDVEISTIPVIGGTYFNVVSSVARIWTGVAWTNGTGSGTGTVANQSAGVIPAGTSANNISNTSHLDDGNTVAGTVTSSEPVNTTNTSSGYEILGIPWIKTATDSSSDYQTWVGWHAANGATPGAAVNFESTCMGTASCGASGTGMSGSENTGLGWHAGSNWTTANFSTAVGVNSLGTETTGVNNTAIGEDSQRDTVGNVSVVTLGSNAGRNLMANQSIGLGASALGGYSGTTATTTAVNRVTAVGYQAFLGSAATTGSDDIAIGWDTLQNITTANFDTVIGSNAGAAITSGGSNVLVGGSAGNVLTTQTNDVAIGFGAMQSAADSFNVAIGTNALIGQATATGGNNVAIGTSSMSSTSRTTATANATVGNNNLQFCTTCVNTAALGDHALSNLTTGNANTAVGSGAGRFISGGSTAMQTSLNSVYVGANAYPLADGDANENVFGYAAVGHGTNTTTIGNSSVTQNYFNGVIETNTGTAIASAATIAPVAGIFHVTGTAAISTMTPPYGSGFGGCLTLIADAAWTTTAGSTAGQFKSALTAVATTPYTFCYDGTLWYGK